MPKDLFVADALADKSVLVTGGGSGLGLEISKALANKGAAVRICDRRANVPEAAAKEIGEHVHWHVCDVRDPDGAWEKLSPIPEAELSATSADTIPLGRFGQMHELQNLIIFLQSDGCDYLTGQTIAIDGGQHLAQPGTFADLNRMSDEQRGAAREAIQASTAREKANRAKGQQS